MPSEAWDLAQRAAASANVSLRPLETVDDADQVLRVMAETWGEHELMPREMLIALAESGCEPWCALDGDRVVGYVLGWAGIDPEDGIHVHSHMLATSPARRHGGIGQALKLAQRAAALDRGISIVRWTFDPLLARNAHVNLTKLGAHADRFRRDFYGGMTDSLNAGDRSDRLVVRWDLTRPPVPDPLGDGRWLVRAGGAPEEPEPIAATLELSEDRSLLAIPRDYADLRQRDPALASAWRDAVGEALEGSLAAGFQVAGFDADRAGGFPRYVLSRGGRP